MILGEGFKARISLKTPVTGERGESISLGQALNLVHNQDELKRKIRALIEEFQEKYPDQRYICHDWEEEMLVFEIEEWKGYHIK